ncbi:MAG TPA: lipid-A-disaccharide synthase [Ignavibacteriaceae bacterium]|nr:lipid-A-disaccharide synthase [Ignavibacteriaceae bacterium]
MEELHKVNHKSVMIIAGEASGDLHGSFLVRALKKLDNEIEICGIGGDKMKAQGMDLIYHINKMAFLGFAEVLKHLPFIRRVQKDLLDFVRENKIKTVVLIDYPGFNLDFAEKVKACGVKLIYFISPQIWAWGAGRIKKIKKLIDKMLVVFPFEEELYKKHGVNVEFVGHPLEERLNEYKFLDKEQLIEKFNLDPNKEILLLMPGSRTHEVEQIFPEILNAAVKIAREFNMQIVVVCSDTIDEEIFARFSDNFEIKVVKGFAYDLMKYAKFGIIKSGTSTLEAGIFRLPMVIVYKTNYLTYFIGRQLVKVKNIGLVNIIAGEKIIPEFVQSSMNAESIYNESAKILSSSTLYNTIKEKLGIIRERILRPAEEGASEKAARSIYALMNES